MNNRILSLRFSFRICISLSLITCTVSAQLSFQTLPFHSLISDFLGLSVPFLFQLSHAPSSLNTSSLNILLDGLDGYAYLLTRAFH